MGIKMSKQKALLQIEKAVDEFRMFRKEKSVIKTIHFKTGVLETKNDSRQWNCVGTIIKALEN